MKYFRTLVKRLIRQFISVVILVTILMEGKMDSVIALVSGSFLESLIFALIIGAIVTIDVSCLIASQYQDYSPVFQPDKYKRRTPWKQALMHAFWHASLFLIYMGIFDIVVKSINFVIPKFPDFLIFIADIFSWMNLPTLPDFDKELALANFTLLLGVGVLMFVWSTYSGKLVENHQDKLGAEGPDLERFDIKFVYWVIQKIPFLKVAQDNALALSVAVDMLAISALIRFYFPQHIDGQTEHSGWQVIFWGSPSLDMITFGVLVGIVVFLIALFVGRKAKSFEERPKRKLRNFLIFMRFLEPLLVFSFLASAITHFYYPMSLDQTIWSVILGNPLSWSLAVAFWLSLIVVHGTEHIAKVVYKGIDVAFMSSALRASKQSSATRAKVGRALVASRIMRSRSRMGSSPSLSIRRHLIALVRASFSGTS